MQGVASRAPFDPLLFLCIAAQMECSVLIPITWRAQPLAKRSPCGDPESTAKWLDHAVLRSPGTRCRPGSKDKYEAHSSRMSAAC